MHLSAVFADRPDLINLLRQIPAQPEVAFPLLSAKIKLTWHCNFKCRVCRLWQRPELYPDSVTLSKNLVADVLGAMVPLGLRKIHFSGGEALLHQDFPEIIALARGLKLQVNLTSNGFLLDKGVARFLVEQRVHSVAISIDSGKEREHDLMRGVKGAWQHAWDAIDHLVVRKEKKGHGPKVAVNTIVTRHNLASLDELFSRLIEHRVNRWRLLPVDTEDAKLRPTQNDWQALAQRWDAWRPLMARLPLEWSTPKSARRAGKGKYAGDFYQERMCYAPWFNIFIDADGKVYPCCMGKTHMQPYGKIQDAPLAKLLAGQSRRIICSSLASGHHYPVCENCDDFLEENELIYQNLSGGKND